MINTKEALLKFIADNAGIGIDIKEEDTLMEDVGLDELDMIELVMALEEEFSIEIDDENTEKFITGKDIIDYLISKGVSLN